MHATALCYVVDPIGRALFGQWSALLKGKFSRFVCRGRRVENKSVGGRWHFFLLAARNTFPPTGFMVFQFNMEDGRNAVWSFTGGE